NNLSSRPAGQSPYTEDFPPAGISASPEPQCSRRTQTPTYKRRSAASAKSLPPIARPEPSSPSSSSPQKTSAPADRPDTPFPAAKAPSSANVVSGSLETRRADG